MSESKHTPGPWSFSADEDDDSQIDDGMTESRFGACDPDTGATIAVTWFGRDQGFCVTPAEAEANARLIAAAPDLLGALREVRKYVVVHRNDFGEVLNEDAEATLAQIDALIARVGTPLPATSNSTAA